MPGFVWAHGRFAEIWALVETVLPAVRTSQRYCILWRIGFCNLTPSLAKRHTAKQPEHTEPPKL